MAIPILGNPHTVPAPGGAEIAAAAGRSGDFQYVWRTGSIRLATNPCGSSRKDLPNVQGA